MWEAVLPILRKLISSANAIDLLRLRQIDFEAIHYMVQDHAERRKNFIIQNGYGGLDIGQMPLNENQLNAKTEEMVRPLNGITIDFNSITIDEIKSTIETLNSLIVRLPTKTYHNLVTSKHIFQDWKKFVDESLNYLVDQGKLWTAHNQSGIGTDGKTHTYTEYYVDRAKLQPLIDYSYITYEDGLPLYDRWDYWTVDDFKVD